MTTKKKKQLLTLLTTTEVLLFFATIIVIFTFTTGIFTPSKWSTGNTQNSKSFSSESHNTLGEKNMRQQAAESSPPRNTFLPTVSAATSNDSIVEDDWFSENNIMIQANELLIFDEL